MAIVKGTDVTFDGAISHGSFAMEPQSGGAAGGLWHGNAVRQR